MVNLDKDLLRSTHFCSCFYSKYIQWLRKNVKKIRSL